MMLEYEDIKNNMLEYERLYKIAKMKYMIMEKLEEEQNINKISEFLKQKDVYIYGAGTIGKKLYKTLKNLIDIRLLGFIEKDKKDDNIMSLKYDSENICSNAIIIITPMEYYNDIIKDIKTVKLENEVFAILELL